MSENTIQVEEVVEEKADLSPGKLIIKNFVSNRMAIAGLIIFISILILIIVVPLFTSSNLNDIADVIEEGANQPPSASHILGTDNLGRDYFNRLINGGFITLSSSFVATIVATFLGLTLGSIAGYFGGVVDNIIMRAAEILSSIPFLVLAIIMSALVREHLSEKQRIYMIMVVLGGLG
ncbi:MAG: ABC transporter permease, partial [Bacilli bacterium]